MAMQGGFKRKSKVENQIPSSSLADIAFLLLIFFMVTTVFRREQPRDVEFPDAASTERVDERRQNIMHVWIEPDGTIFINDRVTPRTPFRGSCRRRTSRRTVGSSWRFAVIVTCRIASSTT
jgi:biopolymer transport protein ExbD